MDPTDAEALAGLELASLLERVGEAIEEPRLLRPRRVQLSSTSAPIVKKTTRAQEGNSLHEILAAAASVAASVAATNTAALSACGATTIIKNFKGKGREKNYQTAPQMVEKAIRLSFKMRDDAGGVFPRGYAMEVQRQVGVNYKTVQRWCAGYVSVVQALAGIAGRSKGAKTLTPVEVEARLYQHIIQCWKSGSTPTRPYVIAQWKRLSDLMGIKWDNAQGIPSDKAFFRYCKTWNLSERIPSQLTWRRSLAETDENILGFFNGKTETIPGGNGLEDIVVTWRGYLEVLAMPCDTRDGKCRSFSDCLVNKEERMANVDEICVMQAAKEPPGVCPIACIEACRQWSGDRTALTAFVTGGCFGTLAPRYFIKKGTVWTYDLASKISKMSKLKVKADGYTMDGETLVEVCTLDP